MIRTRYLVFILLGGLFLAFMISGSTQQANLTPEERAALATERERIKAEIEATPLTQEQIDDLEESYRICLSGFGAFITAEAVQSCREVADQMAYDYRKANYRAGGN